MDAFVELGNNLAGCFLKQTRHKGVDQCGTGGREEAKGKPKRKTHVLEKAFINGCRVIEKNALDHIGSFRVSTKICQMRRDVIPNLTAICLICGQRHSNL